MKKKNRIAVFLDRDGTINEDTGYLSRTEDLVLIDGSSDAIKALNGRGIEVIIITNQSGVARGYFTERDLEAINTRLLELLSLRGAEVDAVYVCPHHPEEGCNCRKPGTGLIEKAAKERGVSLSRSYVVGDKATDVELARNAGSKAVLVLSGQGRDELGKLKGSPDFVARDLREAVSWILEDLKGETSERKR